MREERVTIFGNIIDIPSDFIRRFRETTGTQYGGTYPSRRQDLPDEEVVRKTHEVLTQAGTLDTSPTILCSSNEEKMRRILDNCALRRRQNGPGLYWIVDSDPDSLAAAVRSIRDEINPQQAELLPRVTLTGFNVTRPFDRRDPVTGVRVVALSFLYCFPTHPTPAS